MELKVFIQKFADQFDDTDANEITAETVFHDLDEWSSLVGLAVLNMCDKEYGVSLKFDDLKNSVTVKNLFDLVKKKQNNG